MVRARFNGLAPNPEYSFVAVKDEGQSVVCVRSDTVVSATEYAKAALDAAEQPFDAKMVGDELHDILAASGLQCGCDENKCTACRLDDLAHRLSPFAPDIVDAGLEAEQATVQAKGRIEITEDVVDRFRRAIAASRKYCAFCRRHYDEHRKPDLECAMELQPKEGALKRFDYGNDYHTYSYALDALFNGPKCAICNDDPKRFGDCGCVCG